MRLTVDVGNTTTGIAVFDGDTIVSKNKLMTPGEISVTFLKSLIKKEHRKPISHMIVSSVVPFVDESLRESAREFFGLNPVFLDHQVAVKCGLKLKIDIPSELGADRIADTFGVLYFYQPPYIVIDSGTATTFDVVNRDFEYIGGCIFPGVELSINSLAQNAAKLGRIHFCVPTSILGKNTEEHIKAGIFFCNVGGMTYMIDEYKKILGNDAKVVATGGLVYHFANRVKGIDRYEEDLIYYGLKKILDILLDKKG